MSSCDAFRLRGYAGLALLTLFSATSAFAQGGQGKVSGLVTVPSSAIVVGAQVVLHNSATGLTQHTVTNAAGLYTFPSVNPGEYDVTASQKGFTSTAHEHVTVSVGSPRTTSPTPRSSGIQAFPTSLARCSRVFLLDRSRIRSTRRDNTSLARVLRSEEITEYDGDRSSFTLDVFSDAVEAVIHTRMDDRGWLGRLIARCFSCLKIAIHPSWPLIPERVSSCATSSPGEK